MKYSLALFFVAATAILVTSVHPPPDASSSNEASLERFNEKWAIEYANREKRVHAAEKLEQKLPGHKELLYQLWWSNAWIHFYAILIENKIWSEKDVNGHKVEFTNYNMLNAVYDAPLQNVLTAVKQAKDAKRAYDQRWK